MHREEGRLMTTNEPKPNMPDSPCISGLTFRHYRGENDIAGMLAVHQSCREADQVDPFSVCYRIPNLPPSEYIKDVSNSLSDGSGCNVVIAEIDQNMIAHSRLEWWGEWDSERDAEKHAYLSRGWVVPQWRGKGIGTALLRWAEARARGMDRGCAAPGELAANASDGEQSAIELLQNEGYQLRFLSPELAHDLAELPSATPLRDLM
jgi:GNAT superfamily N-acetyltransferase